MADITKTDITMTCGERTLMGAMFTPSEVQSKRPGLLFIHGKASSQRGYQPRAERASQELGLVCMTFDLGGHGASEGDLSKLSARDHLAEVVTAYDVLARSDTVVDGRIGVCAASYGGYLASLAVSQRDVWRLLLRAPALYPDDDFDLPLSRKAVAGTATDALKLIENLHQFKGDVLVVESEKDESISHETILTYLEACQHGTHAVLEGAEHELSRPEWNEAFMQEILAWFRPQTV